MPRALDLFCGAAGGWSLGLHRAGFETVAACEIDPWRRAVFARNFPRVRMYDDVRSLTAARLAGDGITGIDLVCGSPPCQDASTANSKGRGIDDPRTGLFGEAIRLVGELRPRWVALENVPGLRARGVDRVLADLEALGYAVWPTVVGARHVGAPHKRDRVWIVAHTAGAAGTDYSSWFREGRSERAARGRSDGCGGPVADAAPVLGAAVAGRESDRVGAGDLPGALEAASGRGQSHLLGAGGAPRSGIGLQGNGWGFAPDADRAGLAIGEGERGDARAELPAALRAIGAAWPGWNGGVAGIGDLDDGLPRGVARPALAAYGDAIVPQIAESIGRAILRFGGERP